MFGAPSLSSTTPMFGSTDETPSAQKVPEGITFNLTCEIPSGAEYKGWFLQQDDQIWPLDDFQYADNMEVNLLLYMSVFHI